MKHTTDDGGSGDKDQAGDEARSGGTGDPAGTRSKVEAGEIRPARYLAASQRRDLEPVDDVLGAVVGRFGGSDAMRGAELMDRWADLGGEWAVKAVPVALRDGVLTIEVRSGGDATLLRYDAGAIRARIRGEYGSDLVRSIKVRVGRPGGR